jgi:hypothetical protein
VCSRCDLKIDLRIYGKILKLGLKSSGLGRCELLLCGRR